MNSQPRKSVRALLPAPLGVQLAGARRSFTVYRRALPLLRPAQARAASLLHLGVARAEPMNPNER